MADKADLQPENFRNSKTKPDLLTTATGAPVWDKTTALTAGPRGPMLIQDVVYLEAMAHFDRERIPERVVHAKGAGAHGYFEVTHDITKYCKAKIFSEVGKRTPLFIRFSTVGGESGSADTVRDPRGFAMKFYTEEGNWDLVGNNTPIFFIRDPHLFPDFIHTQKRNPVTHLKDATMMWDFFSLRPESLHQVMFLFSDRGTPHGHRHMNGYGSHTFKLVNARGDAVYCKFHVKTAQGVKNFTVDEAKQISVQDPDFGIRDLYNSIENGDFPQWNFHIQVMTLEQAASHRWNPFDVTKVWPQGEFPLIPVGRIVLNRNPANYFAEVEQSAFAPAHVVPGIEFSPDKMLQGRLFAYMDTHYHRLGVNHNQIPINCPYRATPVANTQIDGHMNVTGNQNGTPTYHPNTFNGPVAGGEAYRDHKFAVNGEVSRFDAANDNNYEQPAMFWSKVLDDGGRKRLVDNLADSLSNVPQRIFERVITEFSKVNRDFGRALQTEVEKAKQTKTSSRL